MPNQFLKTRIADVFLVVLAALCGVTAGAEPLKPVPIQQVHIDDEFWSPKIQVWRQTTIPDCFAKFEKDGALANFDKIRDGSGGEHGGAPWFDGLIYEMIRGSADFLAAKPDPNLEARLDGYIKRIADAAAKDPGGYLNTYTQLKEPAHRWGTNGGNDRWQHDLYNAGALMEAAVHYYRATGKTQLLQVAVKLANTMTDTMGPPPRANIIPGHALGEASLVSLYRLFHEQPQLKAQMPVPVEEDRYLALAQFWIDARGHHEGRTNFGAYDQDEIPVLEQKTIEGHAVRATLLCAGLVAAGDAANRPEYLSEAQRLWDNMVQRKMYITGGLGAVAGYEGFGPDYVLPNNGYVETCAAVGAGFFHEDMNLTFADAKYADELERALYNGVLPGVSLRGDSYFYENPLESGPDRSRWSWNACPCCPPMFLKIMGALPGYIYARSDSDLYVNLFLGNSAEVTLSGVKVKIQQQTAYPWDGKIHIAVRPEHPVAFGLHVRLPGWCSEPRLLLNGKRNAAFQKVQGYAVFQRRWQTGDSLDLDLPMPVQRIKADPAVQADAGKVALQRGPLVYCLEAVDNGDQVRNLSLSPDAVLNTERRSDLLGGVVVIRGRATIQPPGPDTPYSGSAGRFVAKTTEFTAIPYYANANRHPGNMLVWLDEVTEAKIRVDAGHVLHPVSRTLTGACLEDVNHEVYGGIYSQMIFGESFQEPAAASPPPGFTAYDGDWKVTEDGLSVGSAAGAKLLWDAEEVTNGEAEVNLKFSSDSGGNAGFIVRVNRPGVGADAFWGYEIALAPAGYLVLARHRQNFEPISRTPCTVPLNQWINLKAIMTGATLQIVVDGKNLVTYTDTTAPLPDGQIGLRTWQQDVEFRHLSVIAGDMRRAVAFRADTNFSKSGVSGMWQGYSRDGATGRFALVTNHPYLGGQSQRIELTAGAGEVGVENRGLNRQGMFFAGGHPYEGCLCVRSAQATTVCVACESADGATVLAEQPLSVSGNAWQRLAFQLVPSATNLNGRFSIKLKQPGSVEVGYAFLQPGPWGRFHGLPVRRDVAEGLVNQGVTVLRYGGSMVNAAGYRWKKMVGPRERRPPYQGLWYRYSSNGWGIIDFLDLCEAANVTGIPAFNMDESPDDMADFIDYANGPTNTVWGARRAMDGHPQPYGLKYLELGNEERVDDHYFARFKPLAEAIWAKDTNVIITVGDFAYSQPIADPSRFRGADSGITNLAGQQKILQLAREHDREVWFDIHVWTEGPASSRYLSGMFSFQSALEQMAGVARCKVVVYELNANNHGQRRALANALAINAIERNGRIPVTTSANCLQVDGQNDNGWNQGLLFLNQSNAWLQPPGYVTQMKSKACLPLSVACTVSNDAGHLDVSAMRSADGRRLCLHVVNLDRIPTAAAIQLAGFIPANSAARVEELSAPLDAANPAGQPSNVVPAATQRDLGGASGSVNWTFKPYSFSVITFEGVPGGGR